MDYKKLEQNLTVEFERLLKSDIDELREMYIEYGVTYHEYSREVKRRQHCEDSLIGLNNEIAKWSGLARSYFYQLRENKIKPYYNFPGGHAS